MVFHVDVKGKLLRKYLVLEHKLFRDKYFSDSLFIPSKTQVMQLWEILFWLDSSLSCESCLGRKKKHQILELGGEGFWITSNFLDPFN